jgi:hypothetical protein
MFATDAASERAANTHKAFDACTVASSQAAAQEGLLLSSSWVLQARPWPHVLVLVEQPGRCGGAIREAVHGSRDELMFDDAGYRMELSTTFDVSCLAWLLPVTTASARRSTHVWCS